MSGETLRHGPERGYQEIIRQYGIMLIKSPRSLVFVSMADTCLRAGRVKLALEVLEKGLKFHPGLASALTLKARVLMALGEAEKAREILAEVAGTNPQNVLARKLLAEIYLKSGEPEKGIGYLEEIRRIWPDHEPLRKLYEEMKRAVDEGKNNGGIERRPPGQRQSAAIETLERWLNNANQMAKG